MDELWSQIREGLSLEGLTTELAGAAIVAVITFVFGGLAWRYRRWRRPEPVSVIDGEPWLKGIRAVMHQSWVADGSPLSAVDQLQQDLRVTAEPPGTPRATRAANATTAIAD